MNSPVQPEAGPSSLGPRTHLGADSGLNTSIGPDRTTETKGESSSKGKSRRVPYEARQRVEISCDRCKKRKIRCKRSKGPENPCDGCIKHDLHCESTLPRKERSYIRSDLSSSLSTDSDESLSLAIIRYLAPEAKLNSKEDLVKFAYDLGVDILSNASPASSSRISKSVNLPQKTVNTHSVQYTPTSPINESQRRDSREKIPEGRLLPAPAGGYHYVGPASSIYFAITVRHLVSKTNRIWMAATEGNIFERMIKAAEFTSFGVSKALEARIEGHPATNAANDEGEANPAEPLSSSLEDDPLNNIRNATSPLNYLRHGHWKSLLPNRQTADNLVQAFFDRVHPNYTLFHRGTFYTLYEVLWSLDDHRIKTIDAGWVCALMMVFVLGALALEGSEFIGSTNEIQQRYLTIVLRDGLPRLAMTASLFNVQTLMLLALYQHNAGERNGAWMLIGQAARMAIALGMHRDGDTGNFDPIERNTRRMVWWILYNFEQNMSFVLGRPSATDIIDRTVRLPDENVMDGYDLPPNYLSPTGSLSELSVGVKRFVASISVDYDKMDLLEGRYTRAQELFQQLDQWFMKLPQHLHPQSHFPTPKHRRAVLLLHIHYHYIRSILGRPFLLGIISHAIENQSSIEILDSPPSTVNQLAEMSIESARSSIGYLGDLASSNLLEGQVWLDLFYVHHATFILGLPLLSCPLHDAHKFIKDKLAVRDLLGICQNMLIAPTYRILLNIAMQFAYVVDWGPLDLQGSLPEGINTNANTTSQSQGTSINDMVLTDNTSNTRTQIGVGDLQPPLQQQTHQHPQISWDQFFGPLPSRQSSPQDLSTDLYNYGLDTDHEVPWDFFNLSALVSHDPTIEVQQSHMIQPDSANTSMSMVNPSPSHEIQTIPEVLDLLSGLQ
ncbi:uncharacterized protein L201_004846 [Kwoniella dendrophila CBS 6074]|uniref:Zn(2)-C6 fungal-type domain-containing protein n=1 Tax=Kwoniella dendrophila CBS 6074 TaxID=1295534 RepID=A0AAX4JX39_9TREE